MKEVIESFENNLKISYLTYALSVITARAIPDVRDGLKPVQRRILYSMYELKLFHNKPFKKSARIVGETLGKYHPHGDAAIYDALVRMAQNFSMNHPLVDGQGNFGSIDGDAPAAMRYTEARLAKIAEEMFKDIEYNVIDFKPNFDNSIKEPEVLPARFPNILINGASGIAVGLSTEIPPHNLREVIDCTLAILKKEQDPLKYIKGPDFPTGGVITYIDKSYLQTGKGYVELIANYEIDDNKIIIKEIPYGVPKSVILKSLYDIKEKELIRGIKAILDKSGKEINIEIIIDRNYNPQSIIVSLLNQTKLKYKYYINMVVLDKGKPVTLGVIDILNRFIEFRREIIIKRAKYFKAKYEQQLEKINSYIFAIQNINKIIDILKNYDEPELKLKELGINDNMINHILSMNLKSLKKQEINNLIKEKEETIKLINQQEEIILNPDEVLIKELEEIKINYGKDRKTTINESLVLENYDYKVAIIYRNDGLKKVLEIEAGKNRKAGVTYGENILGALIVNNNSKIAVFTDTGQVYKLDVNSMENRAKDSDFELVEKYGINGKIIKILPYKEGEIVILTASGNIKRMKFKMIKSTQNYITRDTPIDVNYVDSEYLTIITAQGKAIRFKLDKLKARGRKAGGVKGIKGKAIRVITTEKFIVGSEKGYIKVINDVKITNRGGKGVYIYKTRKSSGALADACNYSDEIIVIMDNKIARVKLGGLLEKARAGVGKKIFNKITKLYNI